MGHPEGYTATDIIARYKRMTGHNVLHPMGWDAFGLPAEQYAIQTGTHPRTTTERNIAMFRKQLKSLGFSYDWSREIATTDPEYFKWTQWIFTQLFERGLAYQAEVRGMTGMSHPSAISRRVVAMRMRNPGQQICSGPVRLQVKLLQAALLAHSKLWVMWSTKCSQTVHAHEQGQRRHESSSLCAGACQLVPRAWHGVGKRRSH